MNVVNVKKKGVGSMEINIGDYIEGHKIVCIEKDPFVRNQYYVETDAIEKDAFGDMWKVAYHIRKGESK